MSDLHFQEVIMEIKKISFIVQFKVSIIFEAENKNVKNSFAVDI